MGPKGRKSAKNQVAAGEKVLFCRCMRKGSAFLAVAVMAVLREGACFAEDAGKPGALTPGRLTLSAGFEGRRLAFPLADELVLTPTHPDDVDSRRPPRSQPTEVGSDWAAAGSIGMALRPLPTMVLRRLGIGYRLLFTQRHNSFRGGKFSTRLPYSSFICGSGSFGFRQCEEAYTYTRISRLAATSELRLTYHFPFLPRCGADKNVAIEVGAKRTFQSFSVTQGWDRYDKDQVYRTTALKPKGWGGIFAVSFGENVGKARVRLGVDVDLVTMPAYGASPARAFWAVAGGIGFEYDPR